MLCPNCKTPLSIAERSRIEIDYCPTCRGIWLDRGELDKLIDAASEQAPPAQPAGSSFFAGGRGPQYREDQYRDDQYRGEHYRGDHYRDDDDYKHGRGYGGRHSKHRRKSFLSELFDFD